MIIDQNATREVIKEFLQSVPGVSLSVASAPSQAFHHSDVTVPADMLILDPAVLDQLLETTAPDFHRFARKICIVLALTSTELLETAEALRFVDAWLFMDVIELERLMSFLMLAMAGYTVMPGEFMPGAKIDQLRKQAYHTLSGEEQLALLKLVSGKRNPQLAVELGVSEERMKVLVRNVFRKLHFRNRTQAGVFAARHIAQLSGKRHCF